MNLTLQELVDGWINDTLSPNEQYKCEHVFGRDAPKPVMTVEMIEWVIANSDSNHKVGVLRAYLLMVGNTVEPRNHELARHYFQVAHDAGFSPGTNGLAYVMELNSVSVHELHHTFALYEQAQNNGSVAGMFNVARCYINNAGVRMDKHLGVAKLCHLEDKYNYIPALLMMGDIGTRMNLSSSIYWKRALILGDHRAKRKLQSFQSGLKDMDAVRVFKQLGPWHPALHWLIEEKYKKRIMTILLITYRKGSVFNLVGKQVVIQHLLPYVASDAKDRLEIQF